MFRFTRNQSSKEEGLSQQQVSTLMRHLSCATSICMVQPPPAEDFDKGKKEFRRSMRKRENVDFYKIQKQRLLKQKSEEEEEEGENNNIDQTDNSCCSHLRRFSSMLVGPMSFMDYKDLIKSISSQLFSKSSMQNFGSSRKNSKNSNSIKLDGESSDESSETDSKTMNFVLTQKFIGWKV